MREKLWDFGDPWVPGKDSPNAAGNFDDLKEQGVVAGGLWSSRAIAVHHQKNTMHSWPKAFAFSNQSKPLTFTNNSSDPKNQSKNPRLQTDFGTFIHLFITQINNKPPPPPTESLQLLGIQAKAVSSSSSSLLFAIAIPGSRLPVKRCPEGREFSSIKRFWSFHSEWLTDSKGLIFSGAFEWFFGWNHVAFVYAFVFDACISVFAFMLFVRRVLPVAL